MSNTSDKTIIPKPTFCTPEQNQLEYEYQESVRQCKHRLFTHDVNDLASKLLIEDPQIDNGSRAELVDLIIRNQDRIDAAHEANRAETDDHLEIANARELIVKTITTPPELIAGILYQGGKMSFNASSKMGKTWSLLHLGISLSEGLDWFGYKTSQCKVLFINPELQNFSFEKRIQQIARNLTGQVSLEHFDYISTRGKKISNKTLLPLLQAQIVAGRYGAIILDSIYKLYPRDTEENSSSDVAEFLGYLETLAEKTGAAIIYSHHYSKGNQAHKAAIDRSSGAGAWGRDPDTVVSVTDHDSESCYTVDFNLRDFPGQSPIVIRVNWPNITRAANLDPKKLKTTQFGAKYTNDTLLRLLAVRSYTATELQKVLKDEHGMSSGTFYTLWSAVKTEEGVRQDADKKWSYRHPAGNAANN